MILEAWKSMTVTRGQIDNIYYLQHTTHWTELNVLLYDGTRVN